MCRRNIDQYSADSLSHYRPTIDRLLTDHRPTIDRLSIDYRPTIDRLSTECRLLYRPLFTHSKQDPEDLPVAEVRTDTSQEQSATQTRPVIGQKGSGYKSCCPTAVCWST